MNMAVLELCFADRLLNIHTTATILSFRIATASA